MVIGTVLAGFADLLTGGQLLGAAAPILLPMVALMMIVAGLIASVGPARAPHPPMDALRQD